MMQAPASNIRPSRRAKRAPLSRWLDGIVDKACFSCAPGGYTDEVDDTLLSYDEDDNMFDYNDESRQEHSKQQQRKPVYPDFISSGKSPRRSRARDDASVLFRDADESIQWLLENNQKKHAHIYRGEFDLPTKHRQLSPSSPSSVATATTVQTGSSGRSEDTAIHRGNPRSPTATSGSRSSTPLITNSSSSSCNDKDRAHSRPEDEVYDQNNKKNQPTSRKLLHANSIHSSTTSGAVICPREVLVPTNWASENARHRRIRSETLPRLPFRQLLPSSEHTCVE